MITIMPDGFIAQGLEEITLCPHKIPCCSICTSFIKAEGQNFPMYSITFDLQNYLKISESLGNKHYEKRFEKVMIAYLFLSSAIRLDFLRTRNLNIVLALDVSTIAINKSQV